MFAAAAIRVACRKQLCTAAIVRMGQKRPMSSEVRKRCRTHLATRMGQMKNLPKAGIAFCQQWFRSLHVTLVH